MDRARRGAFEELRPMTFTKTRCTNTSNGRQRASVAWRHASSRPPGSSSAATHHQRQMSGCMSGNSGTQGHRATRNACSFRLTWREPATRAGFNGLSACLLQRAQPSSGWMNPEALVALAHFTPQTAITLCHRCDAAASEGMAPQSRIDREREGRPNRTLPPSQTWCTSKCSTTLCATVRGNEH